MQMMGSAVASLDEAVLVQNCQRGDAAAMRLLYDRHASRILGLAWRIMGRRADAEDVLQETFLRAWQSIDRFEGRSSFGSWIYRIAVNLCRDQIRCRRPEVAEIQEFSTETTGDVLARDQLTRALDQLPQGYREVLVMHDVMELGHPEIASILGVEIGTSKSQLHKARARMRTLLKPPELPGSGHAVEGRSHV